ncbi:MAG: ATP-binding cassette domain-containing protein [Bacteroidota bacterium]
MSISIHLNQIGKKFGREWIFRGLTDDLISGEKLVILGGNGSGKSTLLQVISGFVSPNEGQVLYHRSEGAAATALDADNVKDVISLASPYLQLVEDFTATELIEHVAFFKPFVNRMSTEQILDLVELTHAREKYIKQFSSGMKQRLRLGLAILADTPVLLLDEPVSNLDKKAIQWYQQMMTEYGNQKTVIVCSNAIEEEYFFCNKKILVSDYKK